jgi:mRNA-degrading endonuclease YafQ of YafQ-DinJ toxin-antitoxin module
MLIFEVISGSIKATKRFIKDFSQESGDPKLMSEFQAFLKFREENRSDAPFNAKDYAFQHGVLKGFRHCHLVFGKRVIIYKQIGNIIYLCDFVDHAQYDGQNPKISSFLKGLNFDGMENIDVPEPVSPEKVEELKELLQYMASDEEGREVLTQAAKGHLQDLFYYTRDIMSDADVLATFLRKSALQKACAKLIDK